MIQLLPSTHLLSRILLKSESTRVLQPMVGGTGNKRQGPWPECIGLAGVDCVSLIESYADDLRDHIKIIPVDSMVTMDFSTGRVRVFVDENGIVQRAPSRG
jgi:hypothetical protein